MTAAWIEVELKFPVDGINAIREQLLALGATAIGSSVQSDEYLNDPLRDYSKLDLALRIRQVDGDYWLTYKGPSLDRESPAKVRSEIETQLIDVHAAEGLRDSLLGIGLNSVAVVRKWRETLSVDWQGQVVEVCLDVVDEVGEFVELEILVPNAAKIGAATEQLMKLANQLELTAPIRASYLELLLRQRDNR